MDYEFRVVVEKVAVSNQKVIKRDTIKIFLMNYPAASGRGIRIKKESIAHLCVTGDIYCPEL